MLNRKKWTIVILIGLFLVANLYLIFKKDSEIARSTYVNEWTEIREQNLILSKNKAGVVTPMDVEHVYFQEGSGDFGQFLVKEGEEVEEGTPLFEYSPDDIDSTVASFEEEITVLENERDAIEDTIEDLDDLEGKLSSEKDEEGNPTSTGMAGSIEAQIYEKELQLSKIDAEIEKYENLISIADEGYEHLAVESGIDGIVKKVSHDLQNPVVTITSNEKQIEGILDEEEVAEIEKGMKVTITSDRLKEELKGKVSEVAVNPIMEPQVDQESEYRFTVQLDDDSEILTGAHVEMKIVVEEVEDALTAPVDSLKNDFIYVLKGEGRIEKREVETGISLNHVTEILGEAEAGEFIVKNPGRIKNNTVFYTPMDVGKMAKKDLKELGKKEIFRYLGRGLLTR